MTTTMRPVTVRGHLTPRLVAFLAAVLIASVVLAAASPTPALAHQRPSPGASPGTISIGLRSAPPTPSNDPRAHRYIVDHLSAGASTTRRLEVGNHTDSPQRIEVYAGPATVQGGSFLPASPGESNALTRWIHLDRSVLNLLPGQSAMVTATITVPAGAPDAEQYAVIWASHTSAAPGGNAVGTGTGSSGSAGSGSLGSPGSSSSGSGAGETGLDQISRVGVRVYLSTGAGGAPDSGFEILDLRPVWAAVGVAAFLATVSNTGHRAVDVAGTLDLTDGPGGLATPPLASEPATIAPGETAEIRFPVSEAIPLPSGEWTATVDLASGTEKQTTAREFAVPPVGDVTASGGSPEATTAPVRPLGAGAALLGLAALLLLLWFLVGRRRRGEGSSG